MINKMLKISNLMIITRRTFKNFGHKPEPIPMFTFLWQGFLTFTFIGLGIEWKRVAKFFFGEDHKVEDSPWSSARNPKADDA